MLMNVPAADQRTEVGNDGRAPEDGNMDCVPESLACMVRGLAPGMQVTGDGLHDAVYGQGYIGLQDPERFVGYLAGEGFVLTRVEGSASERLSAAVEAIQAGRPVLLSIPSDWNDEPPTSRYAHMVAGCDTDGTSFLTAMNLWGGFYQRQRLAWWRERLDRCSYGSIWIMQKAGAASVWTMAYDGKGNLTGGHDAEGHHVDGGMAYAIRQRGITADAYFGETHPGMPSELGFVGFCPIKDGQAVLVWDGRQVTDDGPRVVNALWRAPEAALKTPPPGPAPIPDVYVKAKAALDALVAALGAEQQAGW